ncbi:hypothetical protein D0469_18985 [Peribacillus saganii]|uniref:Endolytic transglycosylase MltG n=1 Tax=Peribacillus saganii TaxID=2303992 RepID=A0A372LDM4_9BACI|nr:endolytic transglycosylase MltG [Peribacillus saganii]RFU64289.1 hypothetical protein D0469_18985 [Peribacillus saganii]
MNRSSLRAFSAGIILSVACLAGVSYFSPADTEPSVTEAKELLAEQGYTVSKKESQNDETVNTLDSSASIPKEKVTQEEKKKNAQAAQPDAKKSVNSTEDNTANTNTNDKDKPAAEKSAETYTLTIKSGMTSDKIADILVSREILENRKAFEKYMKDNNLQSKIQVGEFVVTSNMSVEQMVNTITRK